MGNDRVKYSHIIPEFYLHYFSYKDTVHPKNTNSTLLAFKENFNDWKQKGFGKKSIFTLNGIYDFDVISEQIQTVEKYLGTIETGMGIVIKQLQEHKSLTDENFKYLLMFIVSLMHRTPKNMNQFQGTIKKIHDMFEQFDSSQNNEYTKEYFNGYEDAAKIQILKTADIVNASKFYKESFYFLYNTSNTPFITSDNPVVFEDMSKNIIEGILTFPVQNNISINRKSIILPLTPNICVLYCDYLDRRIIDQQVITIFDDNIIFKLNMLQFRNCENFVVSNIDNSQIDYARCYADLCNKDYSQKLIFSTEQNEYVLKAEFIEHEAFSSEIKVYDVDEFRRINSTEKIISVKTKDENNFMRIEIVNELCSNQDYIVIEVRCVKFSGDKIQ